MAVRYRRLLEADVPAIARVHRRACLIAYAFMNWSHGEDEVRDWYAGKLSGWDWGLVAQSDDAVAGFVATSSTHLDQLFVDPEHQKRGIGTWLLRAALERVPAVVTLTVFEANAPARRFYESHGFHEVDRFFNEKDRAVELLLKRDPDFRRRFQG